MLALQIGWPRTRNARASLLLLGALALPARPARAAWGQCTNKDASCVPTKIEGAVDGQARRARVRLVAVAKAYGPPGLLTESELASLDKSVLIGLQSLLGPQGIEFVDMGTPGPCGDICIARADELNAGEALDVAVTRKQGALQLTLTRVRTGTGKVHSSATLPIGDDGELRTLIASLSHLYPVAPPRDAIGAERDVAVPQTIAGSAHARGPGSAPFSAAPRAPHPVDPAAEPRLRELVVQQQQEVEAVRGLRSQPAVKVAVAGDDAFEAALRDSIQKRARASDAARLARWIAFGVAPYGVDPLEAETRARLGAAARAFYDPTTHQLFVRLEQGSGTTPTPSCAARSTTSSPTRCRTSASTWASRPPAPATTSGSRCRRSWRARRSRWSALARRGARGCA